MFSTLIAPEMTLQLRRLTVALEMLLVEPGRSALLEAEEVPTSKNIKKFAAEGTPNGRAFSRRRSDSRSRLNFVARKHSANIESSCNQLNSDIPDAVGCSNVLKGP
jgi:hypothetical protein